VSAPVLVTVPVTVSVSVPVSVTVKKPWRKSQQPEYSYDSKGFY
jgi:hypothetical protein